jgi:DNA-binding transcriptional LysR family regulator
MNLHLLRLFVTVAEQRSFSRAADVLALSQPAVSKGVRELESQVGAPLLERRTRDVRPTEAGAVLLRRGREIFAAEREGEDELRALRGLKGGSLRVGASTTIATYFLPPYLAAFGRSHPDVALRVTSANTVRIVDLLVAREIDVALVEGPVEQEGVEAVAWRRDELVIVAAPSHVLAQRRSVEPQELSGELFIIREPGSGTREVALGALTAAQIAPVRTLEIGSGEAIVRVVAAGLGVAMVSSAIAADQIALGKLRRIRVAGLNVDRPLTRLRIRDRFSGPAASAFDELLNENLERRGGSGPAIKP